MNKIISFALSLALTTGATLGALPAYAQDTLDDFSPVYVQNLAEKSTTNIEPRDAVLYLKKTITSTNGLISLDATYGYDTRTNRILGLNGISNVKAISSYSNLTNPVISENEKPQVSSDGQLLTFRIYFYAMTANDSSPVYYHADFRLEH